MASSMAKLALFSALIVVLCGFDSVRGFRLYMSDTSGSYAFGQANAVATIRWKNTTDLYFTPTVSGLRYFVMTAYNNAGESDPSNELSMDCVAGQPIHFEWYRQKWDSTSLKAVGVIR